MRYSRNNWLVVVCNLKEAIKAISNNGYNKGKLGTHSVEGGVLERAWKKLNSKRQSSEPQI